MSANDTQSVVTQVIQSLVEAWNRGDSTRFANLFRADAHYIDGDGRWLKGRRAIAGLCGGAGETVCVVEEPSISVYGDVAIATFHWTSVADKSIGGIITCVIINKNSTGWSIVALQNTDFR
jgi:uncharacterized protein (TIGR02246 family)